jgi:hypothetical protein
MVMVMDAGLIYAYPVMDGFVKDGDGYDYHIRL